jgi:LysR family pca operon transcriptional activator
VVADELAAGAFVALPFDTSETKGPVGLTMRTDTALSPAFSLLLQAIREAARAQAPSEPAAKSGRRAAR